MSETTPPIRVSVRWSWIGAVLKWTIPVLLAGAMLYLRAEFASHSEVRDAVAPLATREELREALRPALQALPRVATLEAAQVRADADSRDVSVRLQQISNGQSSQQATLEQLVKSQERILNRLDQLADRAK